MKKIIKLLILIVTLVFAFNVTSCGEKEETTIGSSTLYLEGTIVSWTQASNAESYDIYINEIYVTNVTNCAIDLSLFSLEQGENRIVVIARSGQKTGASSNAVTYQNGSVDPTPSTGKYIIQYVVNGQTYGNQKKVNVGTESTLLVVTKTGYEFDGWYLNANYTGTKYTTYTSNEEKTITFYGNLIDIYGQEDLVIPTIIESISNIKEVTIDNSQTVIDLYNQYKSLTVRSQDLITNASLLEEYYEEACNESALKVKNVEKLISNIGYVESTSESKIKAARAAFDKLSKSEQLEVSNVMFLYDAESAFVARTKTNYEGVIARIKELPFHITKAHSSLVEEINTLYSQLGADQSKVYNYEIVEVWNNYINSTLGSYYELGEGFANNYSDFSKMFFGDFYKFILEHYGKEVLTAKSINSLSDFMSKVTNDTLDTEFAKYLFDSDANTTLEQLSSNSFVGYMYQQGKYVEFFKELVIGYLASQTGSNKYDFFYSNESALNYIIDVLNQTKSLTIGNIVSSNETTVTGKYINFVSWAKEGSYNLLVYTKNMQALGDLEVSYVNALMEGFNSNNATKSMNKFEAVTALFEGLDAEQQSNVSAFTDYVVLEYNEIYKEELATTDKQAVLVAAGKAFLMQNTQIEYDQYTSRRWVNVTPEEATSDYSVILDCSSFAQSAVNYALGTTVLSPAYCEDHSLTASSNAKTATMTTYASNQKGKSADVIMHIVCANYTTQAQKDEVLEQVKNTLQPGDFIVYTKTNGAGHIMMYDGDGHIIHSTGTSISMTNANPDTYNEARTMLEQSQGSVVIQSVTETIFSTDSNENSRYLFDSAHKSFSILRPTVRTDAKITTEGLARYVSQNLNIEKSINVGYLHTVQLGQEITYTVNVKNESKDEKCGFVYISETLPANVTYVSSTNGGVYGNGKIVWSTNSIAKGGTYQVSYTVKVTSEGSKVGTKITDSETYVNGIKTNKLVNTIAKGNRSNIAAQAKSMVGDSYSDSFGFIQAAYSAMGTTIYSDLTKGSNANLSNAMLNALLSSGAPKSAGSYYKSLKCFGGYGTMSASLNGSIKIRLGHASMFEAGDIVVTYYKAGSTYKSFLIADESTVLTVTDGKVVEVVNNASDMTKFAESLYAYYYFAIVNPSIMY